MSRYPNEKRNGNEDIILNSLNVFINISTDLIVFQKQLYAQAHLLNRSVFKIFRKIRDQIENLYGNLSTYASSNPEFMNEKQQILQKQIQAMKSHLNNQQESNENPSKNKQRTHKVNNKYDGGMTQINVQRQGQHIYFLQQQIQMLKNELRRNDTEYQIEIKKYNVKYEQMSEEISYYRQELERQQEYQEIIEKLQIELKVLEEVKMRDEQLIQNMAKKIRNLQKQKFGHINFANSKQYIMQGPTRATHMYSPKARIYTKHQ